MPAPDKRFRVDRIVRGQVNGEAVEQADLIYTYPRRQTQLVLDDPFTLERVEEERLRISSE